MLGSPISSYCVSAYENIVFTKMSSSCHRTRENKSRWPWDNTDRQTTSTLRASSGMAWRPSSTEGAYKPQTKAAQLRSTQRHDRPHAQAMGGGNTCPWGFILGCDEGVVWDLGALMQQLRMQGTHSQAIHISFPIPLPGLTHLFSSLTPSHCGALMGNLLRKPCRSHTSLGLQPDTLSAQREPAQGT